MSRHRYGRLGITIAILVAAVVSRSHRRPMTAPSRRVAPSNSTSPSGQTWSRSATTTRRPSAMAMTLEPSPSSRAARSATGSTRSWRPSTALRQSGGRLDWTELHRVVDGYKSAFILYDAVYVIPSIGYHQWTVARPTPRRGQVACDREQGLPPTTEPLVPRASPRTVPRVQRLLKLDRAHDL